MKMKELTHRTALNRCHQAPLLPNHGREKCYDLGMLKNRSVPTDILLPHITYRDVSAAIAWLGEAFGFVEHYRYGDPVDGSQLHLGNAWIMVSRARAGSDSPAFCGVDTQSLTIFVEEVEKHFEKAKAAGARIVEHLHETEYGELQFAALDCEGHHWLFSRHARDVSPEGWGATIAERRK
jgi:uncharacterized glyoxalase superfamily protein PhnB